MSVQNKEHDFNIAEQFSKTEKYIEENKKSLGIIVGTIVVVVLGYLAYNKFIIAPQEEKAQNQMFAAERYFEQDSLKKAVEGDGNYPGFKQIIEQYGSTKTGNLAHYYLGMCYLKTGKFQQAIEELNSYDGGDDITPVLATGAIGDANMELGKTDEAIKYYQKAAGQKKNNFTSPIFLMKAGMALEGQGKYNDAAIIYEKIKKDFPNTNEGNDAAKYLARAKAMVK